jgi:hypothetical protein
MAADETHQENAGLSVFGDSDSGTAGQSWWLPYDGDSQGESGNQEIRDQVSVIRRAL